MHSVLVLDPDAAARDAMCRQVETRGFTALPAASAEETLSMIKLRGTSSLGLVTNVELPGAISGWDMARMVRDYNPHAAIGYRARTGQRDWAMLGVPDSIVIGGASSDDEIPESFYRLCETQKARSGAAADLPAQWQTLDDIVRRERSALYAHFQHTITLIAVLEGADHRYTFANDAYLQLVGREVVGKSVIEAFPEVAGQGYVEILDRVFATGEEFIGHAIEFRMERGGASRCALLDLIYRPMRGAGGEVTGIFVEGNDLTDAHAAQARIETLQNELIHVARVNAMGLLASTLAHELNQPLTAITNYLSAAKMVSRSHPVDSRIAQSIEGGIASALRAGLIIRRLRDLTSNGPSTREDLPLQAIVDEAVEIATTGRFDIHVEYDYRATSRVNADPIQLQQVVLIFIQNALDATRGEARIAISTKTVGANVECHIRDAGSGIPADMLERIFDSFVTTKPQGMGIGLSLAKTIVESHGGTITARNNPEGGATLSFALPRAD